MRFALPVAAILLAAPAVAQTEAEASVLTRIIDTLCLDMIGALNGCETIVLLASDAEPDAADLLIFSDRRASDPQSMLVVARNITFNGPMFGQSPSLQAGDNGAFYINEEQTGVGRTPWTNTLTIVHRAEGFLVAGQTYTTYDRIVGGNFTCDVNLLTGDWVVEADRINPETEEITYDVSDRGAGPGQRPLLADWSWSAGLPAACDRALGAWFNAELD